MYLVTGGCGFIGSHLVGKLAQSGAKVFVLDSMRYGDPANLSRLSQLGSSAVEVIKFDIGKDDVDSLKKPLSGVTKVFHLAAEKHNQSLLRPNDVFRANVTGMYELLDMLAAGGMKKLVFTSSLYAYGRMQGPATVETDCLEPRTTYGLSKVCGEDIVKYFMKRYDVASTVFRVYFTYGPRQYAGMGYKSVIVKNFQRILAHQPPTIYGDGLQSLDYVYIDDVISALINCMEGDYPSETFNISSGSTTTVNELIKTMLAVAKSDLKPTYEAADWTAGSSRSGSNSKAKELLDWAPTVSLEEGLAKTYSWVKEQVR